MKKQTVLLILLFVCVFNLTAGNNDELRLIIPDMPVVSSSLYTSVIFLDDRPDYEFERIKIDSRSFNSQLNSLMLKITDRTARNGTLFFQLRNLSLSKNKGLGDYSHLRVTFYHKIDSDYFFITTVDQKVPIKKTKEFAEIISREIAGLIAGNLTKPYTDPKSYTNEELRNIAFHEKAPLTAYNTNIFADGVYLSFSDFINQTPERRTVIPKFKKNELKEIKIINPENKKERKISPQNIYAVVVDGQPYIATDKEFLPLRFENDEFLFEDEISNSKIGVSPAVSVGIGSGGYRGGGIGIGIFTHSQKMKILFKIDHLTGEFMPVSILE
ncbi:MAG TPA: hypothetical protein DIT04_10595 [Dysgonomonas sp.]|nr:hypothetical protein [Dysgonomonas sp.]